MRGEENRESAATHVGANKYLCRTSTTEECLGESSCVAVVKRLHETQAHFGLLMISWNGSFPKVDWKKKTRIEHTNLNPFCIFSHQSQTDTYRLKYCTQTLTKCLSVGWTLNSSFKIGQFYTYFNTVQLGALGRLMLTCFMQNNSCPVWDHCPVLF